MKIIVQQSPSIPEIHEKNQSLPHQTGVTIGKGTGSLFLAGVPVHNAVGTGTAVASHALGYEQPATVTIPITVSPPLNHPSPPSTAVTVGAGNDCVGSVGTGPVAVYVGSSAASLTRPMEVGGHGYLERSLESMEPDAPGPPVWYASYVPSKGTSCGMPREAQWPFGKNVRDRW